MSEELPPPLAINDMVGNYRIHKVLGRGGFAITYQVEDASGQSLHRTHKYYALKEFFPHKVAMRSVDGRVVAQSGCDREFTWGAGRFVEEALVLQNLHHDNIVRVEGILAENGTIYMLMEFIDGPTLRSTIEQDGPQTAASVRAWLGPALNTLEYIHRPDLDRPDAIEKAAKDVRAHLSSIETWNGINIAKKLGEILLHLDITPQNIMFRKPNQPVLIDFGASRHKMTSVPDDQNISLPVANPRYAPPEQSSRQYEQLTPRTDLFSLGGCVYFALTGTDPIPSYVRTNARVDKKPDPLPRLALADGKRHRDEPLIRSTNAALSLTQVQRPASAAEWSRMIGRPGLDPKLLLFGAVGALAVLAAVIAILSGVGRAPPKMPAPKISPPPARQEAPVNSGPHPDSGATSDPVEPTPTPENPSEQSRQKTLHDPFPSGPSNKVVIRPSMNHPNPVVVVPSDLPPPPPPPAATISGRAVVHSATSLTVGTSGAINLAGIRPSDDRQGGAQRLQEFINQNGGTVTCSPAQGAYRCLANGADLARFAVLNGFAHAKMGSGYEDEEKRYNDNPRR